jgi:hypothetical protein
MLPARAEFIFLALVVGLPRFGLSENDARNAASYGQSGNGTSFRN